ncbi:hypothetical protein BC826DRAFT_1087091 [Russula brevipes]|nr:hypothetical protein BC826DRAFT_1087091 [Russula brevipes]
MPLLSVILLCGYAGRSTNGFTLPIELALGSSKWTTSSLSLVVISHARGSTSLSLGIEGQNKYRSALTRSVAMASASVRGPKVEGT